MPRRRAKQGRSLRRRYGRAAAPPTLAQLRARVDRVLAQAEEFQGWTRGVLEMADGSVAEIQTVNAPLRAMVAKLEKLQEQVSERGQHFADLADKIEEFKSTLDSAADELDNFTQDEDES